MLQRGVILWIFWISLRIIRIPCIFASLNFHESKANFYREKKQLLLDEKKICSDVEFLWKFRHDWPAFRSRFHVSSTWFRFNYNVMAQNANCKLHCCQNGVRQQSRNMCRKSCKVFLWHNWFWKWIRDTKILDHASIENM